MSFLEHGDAQRFAREYIPTIRTWNESTYHNALDPDRAPEQRADIIESFYSAYADRVRVAPEGHGMDYVHAYMVISRH